MWMLKKRFFLAFTMLFITFFALYFKPWEASLPDEILLEFIDVLERVINNKRIVQETGGKWKWNKSPIRRSASISSNHSSLDDV